MVFFKLVLCSMFVPCGLDVLGIVVNEMPIVAVGCCSSPLPGSRTWSETLLRKSLSCSNRCARAGTTSREVRCVDAAVHSRRRWSSRGERSRRTPLARVSVRVLCAQCISIMECAWKEGRPERTGGHSLSWSTAVKIVGSGVRSKSIVFYPPARTKSTQ